MANGTMTSGIIVFWARSCLGSYPTKFFRKIGTIHPSR